jgi:Skp family chaperone for outer membrane proteins
MIAGQCCHTGDHMSYFAKAAPAALLLILAACDGPQEQRGEEVDASVGAVDSEDSMESGPAESLGERVDEAANSAERAVEARAEALEDQAEAQRDAAEQQAQALEQQAEALRGQ